MASKSKKANAEAVETKINRTAVQAIANAISKGIKEIGGTGGLLHSCVTVARQHYDGKPIPNADIAATLETLAGSQGWKGRTADTRKSQYKVVLVNYAQLPKAMALFKEKTGFCSWHDGIALARLLRNKSPSGAANAHNKRGKAKQQDPADIAKDEAKKFIAKFVKRAIKMSKLERTLRDSLAELCEQYDIKV